MRMFMVVEAGGAAVPSINDKEPIERRRLGGVARVFESATRARVSRGDGKLLLEFPRQRLLGGFPRLDPPANHVPTMPKECKGGKGEVEVVQCFFFVWKDSTSQP